MLEYKMILKKVREEKEMIGGLLKRFLEQKMTEK